MSKGIPIPYFAVLAVVIFAIGYIARPYLEESDERICAQILGDGKVNDQDAPTLPKLGLKETDLPGAMMYCRKMLDL